MSLFGRKTQEKGESGAYHVKITDIRTGRIIHEGDSCAIVGAIVNGDGDESIKIRYTHCSFATILAACASAESTIRDIRNNLPDEFAKKMFDAIVYKNDEGLKDATLAAFEKFKEARKGGNATEDTIDSLFGFNEGNS